MCSPAVFNRGALVRDCSAVLSAGTSERLLFDDSCVCQINRYYNDEHNAGVSATVATARSSSRDGGSPPTELLPAAAAAAASRRTDTAVTSALYACSLKVLYDGQSTGDDCHRRRRGDATRRAMDTQSIRNTRPSQLAQHAATAARLLGTVLACTDRR